MRVALTAPILGSAIALIPLFVLNNAGLAIDTVAAPVLSLLLVASVGVLVARRPRVPGASVLVALIAIASLALVGRPLFTYGFDWIANANGDMAFYVLSATQLLHHGLRSGVDLHALAQNRGFSSAAQTLTLRGLRPGTQIMLAGLSSVSDRQPVQLYMPSSIAIAMSTSTATGALAMQATRRAWVAAAAGLLVVASPLAGYGVLQQLLPQNWGLGIGAALFAWLMRIDVHESKASRHDVFVIAVLAVALFVVAYEVAITLAAGYLLYVLFLIWLRRLSPRATLYLWVFPVVATLLVVNSFLPKAIGYIHRYVLQFGTSSGFHGLSQFGYARVPTAVPGALGLRSLFASPQAPHTTFWIALGAIIAIALLAASLLLAARGVAAAMTLVGGIALGGMLARNHNDFGLFKLYMYMQPFAAATLAVALAECRKRSAFVLVGAALVALVVVQVRTLDVYVRQSGNPIDLRHASNHDLLPKLRSLLSTAKIPVVTVTDNFALTELEGAEAGKRQVFFVSRNLFDLPWTRRVVSLASPKQRVQLSFGENTAASAVLGRGRCVIALPSGSQIALNRRALPEGSPDLETLPCRTRRTLLAFVDSSLGQPPTLPANRRAVSLWQLEHDPVFPGRTFSGFGRYALFQVFGPTRNLRVVLDFTSTPIEATGGPSPLPSASVLGARRIFLPVVGRGSARVVSPPLRVREIDGRPYVVLDMGRNGRLPFVPRPGASGLWGKSVVLDPRFLTSYVRDLSVIAPSEYRQLRPPFEISRFPTDLANPNLVYSGIYEDGWVGKVSYVELAGGPRARLLLHAVAAPGSGSESVRATVNGRSVGSATSKAGVIDLDAPIPAAAGRRRVELRWSRVVRLPAPDRRHVAAQLTEVAVRPR